MQQIQQAHKELDSGLWSLVTAAKLLGIPAEMEQLRRSHGFMPMDNSGIIRAARELSLKARAVQPDHRVLLRLPYPAIARLSNGHYVVILRTDGEHLIVLDPRQPRPAGVTLDRFAQAWSGEMILLARRFHLKSEKRKFGISWFIPVIWRYRREFVRVLFASLILQLFALGTPLFTQVIIDNALVHRSLPTLNMMLLGMSLVALFQNWIVGLRSYIFTHTTSKLDVILSNQMFRHIEALPLRYFETWQVGDVVSRVRELENIRQFLTGSSLTVVLDIVFAVICVIVMFLYSGTLSLVALIALPLYIILNLIITPIFRRLLNQRFLAATENQAFLIEGVTGIQTVKSMAVERYCIQKYEEILARFAKASFSANNLGNIAGNIGGFIQQFFTLAILWVGAHIVMDGKMSVGELISFQMIAGQVNAPILRLVNMWQQFQQTKVSIDRVGDIMNEATEPAFNPNRTTLPALHGDVVLERVNFRYRQDGAEILKQVDLKVAAGTRIGIVGRSGSGKSTLTKLLQRLYVPDTGRVLIDGVDLAQVEPAWLRRQIGVVLQDSFLFNGSIKDNIAIADPQAPMEQIVRAAQMAGADEFIREFPKGYDTQVGERGSLLSGGQKQRIAIARALLTDPRILIFDEATSALDYESEKIIMNNLDTIAAGRTMFIIAHRLSTVRNSDRILVIDHGRIIEEGTHDELVAIKGYYYGLYCQQAG